MSGMMFSMTGAVVPRKDRNPPKNSAAATPPHNSTARQPTPSPIHRPRLLFLGMSVPLASICTSLGLVLTLLDECHGPAKGSLTTFELPGERPQQQAPVVQLLEAHVPAHILHVNAVVRKEGVVG